MLWPAQEWSIDPEPLFIFIASAGALLAYEVKLIGRLEKISQESKSALKLGEHDLRIVHRFLRNYENTFVSILKEQDFVSPIWNDDAWKRLSRFEYESRLESNEFMESSLKKQFDPFLDALVELLTYSAQYGIYRKYPGGMYFSLLLDGKYSGDFLSPQDTLHAQEANRLADVGYRFASEFLDFLKTNFPEALDTLEQA